LAAAPVWASGDVALLPWDPPRTPRIGHIKGSREILATRPDASIRRASPTPQAPGTDQLVADLRHEARPGLTDRHGVQRSAPRGAGTRLARCRAGVYDTSAR